MGSRFGGPKQLEPLGPSGETLLDYALFDAQRAGFGRAVLIIRRELRAAFERSIVPRWAARLPLALVEQSLDALPPGVARSPTRTKPWGTAQAVLAAADLVTGPFAVVNGDDFYGRGAYTAAAAALLAGAAGEAGEAVYASVGYPLRATLSASGTVTRAVLRTSADNWLQSIEEVSGIEQVGDDGQVRSADGRLRTMPGSTLVSMNMWAFTPALFPQLAAGFRDFLLAHGSDDRAEFLLPTMVEGLIQRGAARVRVLPGGGPWSGVTHPDDRPVVARFLRDLVDRGEYPRALGG